MRKVVLFIMLCSFTSIVYGQICGGEVERDKVHVAVLGTFHFSNPGMDVVEQHNVKDVLSSQGQKEINRLLKLLESFRPTKILVEEDIKNDSLLERQYREFIDGTFHLNANEIYQIGFKLAKRLGHSKVWAVDSPMWFAEEKDSLLFDDDYCSKYPVSSRYDYDPMYDEMDSLKAVLPLPEYLVYMNNKDIQLRMHQVYLTRYAPVGANDNYVGANVVANWYKRNLKIFANICNMTEFGDSERLLIIIGAGHSYILNQLFSDSPDYHVIKIEDILNGKYEALK